MTTPDAAPANHLLRLDHGAMRTHNLGLVLRAIRAQPGASRAQIASTTGLTKAAVGMMVAELTAAGLTRERDTDVHRRGRPAGRLFLDGSHIVGLAAEINLDGAGLSVRVRATGLDGTEVFSAEHQTEDHDVATAVQTIADLADRADQAAAHTHRTLIGLELAVPALVDRDGLVVINAPGLGWSDVHLHAALREALTDPSYPIGLSNFASYSAIAEHDALYRDVPNLIHLELGSGVGAGIIVDNRPLRGHSGVTGIIGHVQLDPAGPECTCGRRGCFEVFAGRSALYAAASAARGGDPLRSITSIADAFRSGDLTADDVQNVTSAIGAGVAILVNLLGPDVLVLGGYMTELEEWLLPAVLESARPRILTPHWGGARIEVSPFGRNGALQGAAGAIMTRVLQDPTIAMRASR